MRVRATHKTIALLNYELDLSAITASVTDNLTFEIEPPQEVGMIEADHNTLPEPHGE